MWNVLKSFHINTVVQQATPTTVFSIKIAYFFASRREFISINGMTVPSFVGCFQFKINQKYILKPRVIKAVLVVKL